MNSEEKIKRLIKSDKYTHRSQSQLSFPQARAAERETSKTDEEWRNNTKGNSREKRTQVKKGQKTCVGFAFLSFF